MKTAERLVILKALILSMEKDVSPESLPLLNKYRAELELLQAATGQEPTKVEASKYLVKAEKELFGSKRDRVEEEVSYSKPVAEPVKSTTVDRKRLQADFSYFCSFLPITYREMSADVKGRSGPFRLSSLQQKLADLYVEKLFVKREPLRAQVLKSRQLGNTTLSLAFCLWMATFNGPFNTLLIIDRDDHALTKKLMVLDWVKSLREKLPFLGVSLAKGGAESKVLRLSNGSYFFFESARSASPGTSENLHAIIESEKTKWPDNRVTHVQKSVVPALPDKPLTIHIDESTANGLEGFAVKWRRSQLGLEAGILPLFLAWFKAYEYEDRNVRHVEYSDDPELGDFDPKDPEVLLSEEEYARLYNLSPGQVSWRRYQIKHKFGGRREDFDQEYPTTPDHAFRSTSRGYFPPHMLDSFKHIGLFRRGTMTEERGETGLSQKMIESYIPSFRPDSKGDVWLRERPVEGKNYYMGVDAAEGKTAELMDSEDPDWTVCTVIDDDGRQCARLITRSRPEDCWFSLMMLALWYRAKVGIEIPGPGNVFLSLLLKAGFTDIFAGNGSGGEWRDRLGTRITKSNRATFLNVLRITLREDTSRFFAHDGPVLPVAQYGTFIVNKDGKAVAASGGHDDIVFADAHACWVRYHELGLGSFVVENDHVEPVPLEEGTVRLLDPNLYNMIWG